MKVLVTGSKGQLGIDLVDILSIKYDVVGYDSDKLDITNIDKTIETVRVIKPDIIINSAAYTNVDACEENIDLAYKVNALGARNLAVAALEINSRLLHISTDFVFDGTARLPYIEFDNPNPLSVYGKSKLAGEDLIRHICPKHYILRTAWLYGEYGNNFVKTMLRLSKERDTLTVVDDQFGSPTYTKDLIRAIECIIGTEAYGTYHTTNDGECSWNEFARTIFEYAGIDNISVLPITTEELNRPAKRPKYSVLKNYLLELQFDYHMRHWREGLKEYFK